jgi:N-acetylglucosamine kinase-like BadF-type ATPase
MRYYLGIDIGATKSHALIADETGLAVGLGEAGPGNHEVVGWEGLKVVLHDIINQAISRASIERSQIAGAGFGVAGYDWPSQRQPHFDIFATLGLDCPIEAVNDAVLGILAGTTQGWGISIISGTGENCWGVDKQRNYGHMTGNSALMGEYGGAGSIVYRTIRDIAKDWGKRGPETQLSQAFIEHTGAVSLDDLLEGLVLGKYNFHAGDAPLVFQVAKNGDSVAVEAIRWAALELADMINGVVRQLGFEDQSFEVVMIGSTFKGGPLLAKPMQAAVHQVAPLAKFIRLNAPPVVGGVLLGMEQAGTFDNYIRTHLIETAKNIENED